MSEKKLLSKTTVGTDQKARNERVRLAKRRAASIAGCYRNEGDGGMFPSDIPTLDEMPKADVSDLLRTYRDTVRVD